MREGSKQPRNRREEPRACNCDAARWRCLGCVTTDPPGSCSCELQWPGLFWRELMFSVIFEVQPRTEQWDAYLGSVKMLRPELEQVPGFVDNIRYRSLTREGWILSLSNWRDEKSVVRWRTGIHHQEVQEKGRGEILSDYHLRRSEERRGGKEWVSTCK